MIESIKNPFVCFQWCWYNSTQSKISGIKTQSIVICIHIPANFEPYRNSFSTNDFHRFFSLSFLLLSISLSWKHLRILCLWLNDSDGITELVYPFLPTVRVLAAQTFTKIQLHQFLRIAITHLRLIQIETISQWLLAGWLCHGGGVERWWRKTNFLLSFDCILL